MAREKSTEKSKSRLEEKCVFVSTCVVMVILSQGVVSFQWMIPYIYVVLTPLMLIFRIRMYWKNRWHYFLLDFCYYANMFCMLFLCIPEQPVVFSIMHALAHGPLVWAIPIYWNSLVLHSLDKVTSTYIHIMPPLLAFVVRWYPEETSRYWFKEFMPVMPELSPIWMYLVPFVAFVIHSAIYSLLVNFILNPPDEVVTSYNYLGEKEGSFLYGLFHCIGPRYRCGMFYFWNWVFCLVTLISSVVCYYFYFINCACLIYLVLVALWNGASYYVHVFSVRGFVEEIE